MTEPLRLSARQTGALALILYVLPLVPRLAWGYDWFVTRSLRRAGVDCDLRGGQTSTQVIAPKSEQTEWLRRDAEGFIMSVEEALSEGRIVCLADEPLPKSSVGWNVTRADLLTLRGKGRAT